MGEKGQDALTEAGVRPARQRRSRETRDKILRALEKLLERKPFDEMTVAELAAEAGLSVGAVYRRFENKDALVPVIFEIYRARAAEFMKTARAKIDPESAGLRDLIHQIMRAAHGFLSEQAHIIRATHLYSRLRPDAVEPDRTGLLEEGIESYRALLARYGDEIRRTDLDRTSRYFFYFVNAILLEKCLYPAHPPGLVVAADGDAFADEMADFLFGYLTTPDHGRNSR